MSIQAMDAVHVNQSSREGLQALHDFVDSHAFWSNSVLLAMQNGSLTKEQYSFFFSQYYFYSKSFTRILSTMMVKCDDDNLRRELIDNLWEEAGESDASQSHPMLFRRFLSRAMDVESILNLEQKDYTDAFTNEYIALCMDATPLECAAILAFATEGLVPRLYTIFKMGMSKIGINEDDLEFFTVHIGCDDGHAEVLEDIVAYYSGQDGWEEACKNAINKAMILRGLFFADIHLEMKDAR